MNRLIALKKYKLYLVAGVFLVIITCLFFLIGKGEEKAEPIVVKEMKEVPLEEKEERVSSQSTAIVVEVKGAVKRPGVYTFQSDDRIEMAIKRAGGFTSKADTIEINQAAKLEDSMMIYVPKRGEEGRPTNSSTASTSPNDGENQGVNVNQADAAELQTISGIGPAKAEAIITYREEHGEFQTIEDLRNISGFGEKTVERLKGQLIVK
ncbi:helix-hairpin-helix domain-containing protein [Bacillus sp. 179-C3.3 HS]|uniref:helix-hairpin-helix domain-containing protein n=1 Tax=Bacillus sp. 179-C3.3 HS TaxID=3232162 RepID=UPI0039A2491C